MNSTIEDLSHSQEILLRVLRVIGASISILGSMSIITHVLKGKRYRKNPMHRLVFGLSVVDLLYSLHLAIAASFIYPVHEPSTFCTMDAFFMILAVASPLYNAALSYYYLLTVARGVPNERFSHYYEPFFHLFVLGVAFSTAILGLFFEIYNPKRSGMGCWVGPYPSGCEGAACDRGGSRSAKIVQLIGSALPMSFSLLSMIICNIILYCTMRRLEVRNRQYTAQFQTSTRVADSKRSSNGSVWTRLTIRSSSTTTATQRNIDNAVNQQQTQPKPVSRRMANQSFCYVAAFFMSYGFGFLHFAILSASDKNLFFLQVLTFFLLPSQGFFNALVYFRPSYLGWRAAGDSRIAAIKHSLFSLTAPRRQLRRDLCRLQAQIIAPIQVDSSNRNNAKGVVRPPSTEPIVKEDDESSRASDTLSYSGGNTVELCEEQLKTNDASSSA